MSVNFFQSTLKKKQLRSDCLSHVRKKDAAYVRFARRIFLIGRVTSESRSENLENNVVNQH